MSVIGNILWLLFGGLLLSLGWLIAGLLCCVTIVGIPFGIQCFKIAGLVLAPFGRDIDMSGMGAASVIGNIVWLLLLGWELALSSAIWGIILCITIVGIPFGKQYLKFAKLALTPFGARVV